MTRQMFWRSGAVHEERLAPPPLSRKWWVVIGALGTVGITAYLLPSFADGRHERGGHLPEVADIQLAPSATDAGGETLPDPYFPHAENWQDLPLFASHGSTEVAAEGEVRLLALQAAFERERSSAAAAQLQVVALQEQLANLQEKQEEVLVLREQIADAEAHPRQATGPSIAETEQKKLADHALLKVTALQEELASLSAQVLKARTTAESEKARAASALSQLEAVQRQLAVVTALQGDKTATDSHLQSKEGRIVDGPDPLPPVTNTTSSIDQGQAPLRSVRPDKSEKSMAAKPRQASLSIGIKPPARAGNRIEAAPVRAPEAGASRLTTPQHEPRNQSVRSVGKPPQRASQQPRLLAQDTQSQRAPGALSLPNDLLPDSRLW